MGIYAAGEVLFLKSSTIYANIGTADGGGDTVTFALNMTSPALDAIAVGTRGCETSYITDQRCEARDDEHCDMGAFELQQAVIPTLEISFTAPVTITLNWNEFRSNGTHELWHSRGTYSGFVSLGGVDSSSYVDTLDSNGLINYFYFIRVTGELESTADSNEAGVFHFALTPGD